MLTKRLVFILVICPHSRSRKSNPTRPGSSDFSHKHIPACSVAFEFFDPNSKDPTEKDSLSLAMAPHFVFPQSLRELEEDHEDNRLYAQNSIDVASLRSSELEEFVKGLSLSLSLSLSHFLNNSIWLLRK